MLNNYIYPVSGETLSLVYDVLDRMQSANDDPFLSILLRELRTECNPYDCWQKQEILEKFLNGIHENDAK